MKWKLGVGLLAAVLSVGVMNGCGKEEAPEDKAKPALEEAGEKVKAEAKKAGEVAEKAAKKVKE